MNTKWLKVSQAHIYDIIMWGGEIFYIQYVHIHTYTKVKEKQQDWDCAKENSSRYTVDAINKC